MGKLYDRNGTWYADYFDADGQRRQKSTRTSDITIARIRLRDLELRTTSRGAHETEEVHVALDYFVNVVHAASPAGTIRCYRQKAAHVARVLGANRLVDKLKRQDVEQYIAARIAEGAHPHSIHKELVVLRGALRSAQQRDRFHGSLELIPKFDAKYTPRTSYLTPDQFIALTDHLVPPAPATAKARTRERREERRINRALYCMLIALASPRRGELEALDWEHVDLERDVIRVPKGKTIARVVKIHDVLRPWLVALHQGSGPVVDRWSNVGRDLPDACVRAGVPRATCNDLRRTFASWLVQAGVSLYVVSRLLGHKSTRMVELVYGQLDDATLTAAIGKLPGSHAGVTHVVPRPGTVGAGGTVGPTLSIVNSVEMSFSSTTNEVPRDGIEPPTRGFSGLKERAPKRSDSKALIRLVR